MKRCMNTYDNENKINERENGWMNNRNRRKEMKQYMNKYDNENESE